MVLESACKMVPPTFKMEFSTSMYNQDNPPQDMSTGKIYKFVISLPKYVVSWGRWDRRGDGRKGGRGNCLICKINGKNVI